MSTDQLIAKAERWLIFIDSIDHPTVAEKGAKEIIEGLLAVLRESDE